MFRRLGLALGAVHKSFEGSSAGTRISKGLGVVLSAGAAFLLISAAMKPERTLAWEAPPAEGDEGPLTAQARKRALEESRPLLVDFTAAWCITCKANERLVLASDAVRARFRESGAVLLVGDFTNRDPAIASTLARHGKAGVPLYLVYSPRAPRAPEVLPELLDSQRVLDAIARAESGSP